MKIWFKTIKDSRIVLSETCMDDSVETRTHKVFGALEKVCGAWDLPVPVWLDMNIREFKERASTRFTKDSFVEEVPFDYLEISVLSEDEE